MKTTELTQTIEKELAYHVLDRISDGVIIDDNQDEWHHNCFNEDYYLIGYFHCTEWLKLHNIDAFEAIFICRQYEIDNGNEPQVYNNSETAVNMLAYIFGEIFLNEANCDTIEELQEYCNDIIG